jgi:hypothetical protein
VVARLDVLVQDHLFAFEGGQGIDHRRGEVVADRGHAGTDGVVEALAGAIEIPPASSSHRHGDVGLLNAALDLLEEFVFEGLEVRQFSHEVVVLRAKVIEDLLVFPVHQPVIRVNASVAVSGDFKGSLGD